MSSTSIDIFTLLKRAAAKEHLGHALLLTSVSIEGKAFRDGLHNFIQFLMCTNPSTLNPCESCDSCLAFKLAQEHEGVHPDWLGLKPESKVGYSLDQIKDIRGRLSLHRGIARERIVVLEDAEDLAASSGAPANALLKILEEPRPETRLLLLSSRPEGILPTLRSRCQIFRIACGDKLRSPLEIEKYEAWKPLWQWLDRGAPDAEWTALPLPANNDSFFKEREEALSELRSVFEESWSRAHAVLPRLSDEGAKEMLGWFHDFEDCLSSLKSHGQAGLQWSAFKTRAKSRTS